MNINVKDVFDIDIESFVVVLVDVDVKDDVVVSVVDDVDVDIFDVNEDNGAGVFVVVGIFGTVVVVVGVTVQKCAMQEQLAARFDEQSC